MASGYHFGLPGAEDFFLYSLGLCGSNQSVGFVKAFEGFNGKSFYSNRPCLPISPKFRFFYLIISEVALKVSTL